jgi:hypothetical protein
MTQRRTLDRMGMHSSEAATLCRNARRMRDGIAQIFVDQDHWNRAVRKEGEEPINCDADGQLMDELVALSYFLEREVA